MTETRTNAVEKQEENEISIEQKLIALYTLQQVDSKIDKIHIVRGELPLEVQDLEDEIAGLETRIKNFNDEIAKLESDVKNYNIKIKETKDLVKKYEDQQNNVRNNREYDSLTKEIEFQELEIQLCEKRIRESNAKIEDLKAKVDAAQTRMSERSNDLTAKKAELDSIVSETEAEEAKLTELSNENEKKIEERLLSAYKRIRKNARNGLAVVKIQRDACGGCFSKIPPQQQIDILSHKKIIVCEYCGRILIDDNIVEEANKNIEGNN